MTQSVANQLRSWDLFDTSQECGDTISGGKWITGTWNPTTGKRGQNRTRTADKDIRWQWETRHLEQNSVSARPGWQDAAKADGGRIYLAEGEKDERAYLRGRIRNVWLLTGIGFDRKQLKEHLTHAYQSNTVTTVIYAHDRDAGGRESAVAVRAICTELNIFFEAKELFPDQDPDSKADIFDFCQLDTDGNLRERIEALGESVLPLPEPQKPRKRVESVYSGDDITEQIKSRVDLRDFVSQSWSVAPSRRTPQYDQYKSQWRDDGNTGSFTVYETYFKDYGGQGTSGDLFTFIQTDQGCDFREALAIGAQVAGVSLTPLPASTKRIVKTSEPPPVAQDALTFDNDAIEADITVHVEYITQADLPSTDLAIKSDMGTGKTELAKRLAQHATSVLAPSHRVALVSNMADRLEIISYEGLTADQVRGETRLAITENSLHKLIDPETGIAREFDLLILDEISQQLPHIAGDTFTGGESVAAYTALTKVITTAGRVIALDGGMNRTTLDWLKSSRPNIKTVVNTYKRTRGPLTIYEDKNALVSHITKLALEKSGVVVVPTDSKDIAKQLARHLTDIGFNTLAIHADNSGEAAIKDFTANINTQLGNYDIVIYSPTYGSGVDIQHKARAVCAILTGTLSAPEIHQLIDRVRHTDETHVHIKRMNRNLDTDPTKLFEDGLARARRTGELCAFDEYDILTYTEPAKKLHKLLSHVDAARNHSLNNLHIHYLHLARGKFSAVRFNDSQDTATQEQLKAVKDTIAAERKARVLASDPVDREAYRYAQLAGKVTEDIRDGFVRWQIEHTAGQDITSNLYDLLHTSKQRGALNLFG